MQKGQNIFSNSKQELPHAEWAHCLPSLLSSKRQISCLNWQVLNLFTMDHRSEYKHSVVRVLSTSTRDWHVGKAISTPILYPFSPTTLPTLQTMSCIYDGDTRRDGFKRHHLWHWFMRLSDVSSKAWPSVSWYITWANRANFHEPWIRETYKNETGFCDLCFWFCCRWMGERTSNFIYIEYMIGQMKGSNSSSISSIYSFDWTIRNDI